MTPDHTKAPSEAAKQAAAEIFDEMCPDAFSAARIIQSALDTQAGEPSADHSAAIDAAFLKLGDPSMYKSVLRKLVAKVTEDLQRKCDRMYVRFQGAESALNNLGYEEHGIGWVIQVAEVTKPESEECPNCNGSGYVCDPAGGVGTCNHCQGNGGLFDYIPSETVPHNSPVTVCLCGSSKWPQIHMRLMMEETLSGRIVIPMGLYGHADFPIGAKAATNDGDEATDVKRMLDRLHFAKIDKADEILVVRVDGYIGSSTTREIAYAQSKGKGVRFSDHSALNVPQLHADLQARGESVLRGETPVPRASEVTPPDNRICHVCDGGPGNEGVCLCGLKAWEAPIAEDGPTLEALNFTHEQVAHKLEEARRVHHQEKGCKNGEYVKLLEDYNSLERRLIASQREEAHQRQQACAWAMKAGQVEKKLTKARELCDRIAQEADCYKRIVILHTEFGGLFQPEGRFHKEANLLLGVDTVVEGGKWLVEEYDKLTTINESLRSHCDRVNAENRELRERLTTFRDCVLNGRNQLEAPCLDNNQTNAVLALFDDHFPKP